jgi:hypothetical protein
MLQGVGMRTSYQISDLGKGVFGFRKNVKKIELMAMSTTT